MKVVLILLLAACASAVTRPPVPTDIPFPYDPNLCKSPIMEWIVVEPNLTFVYAIGVHNLHGLKVNVSMMGTGVSPIDVLVERLGVVEDPDGGWNQYFQIAWTPPEGEQVYYPEIIAVDLAGRIDRRTVLIYAVFDDAPFIFPVQELPVSRMKAAQRMIQVAKKVRFPMTKPVHVK